MQKRERLRRGGGKTGLDLSSRRYGANASAARPCSAVSVKPGLAINQIFLIPQDPVRLRR